MKTVLLAFLVLAAAVPAAADPIDGKAAKAELYDGAKVEVVVPDLPFLSQKDASVLKMALGGQQYYGAVAVPAGEGLTSQAGAAVMNFHDVETAKAKALAACEAKRSGGKPCAIVAEIRPEGWQAGRFQLSAEATAAFESEYLKARKPKAFAVSAETGLWGFARGKDAAAAAIADCAAKGPATDCSVAVED